MGCIAFTRRTHLFFQKATYGQDQSLSSSVALLFIFFAVAAPLDMVFPFLFFSRVTEQLAGGPK